MCRRRVVCGHQRQLGFPRPDFAKRSRRLPSVWTLPALSDGRAFSGLGFSSSTPTASRQRKAGTDSLALSLWGFRFCTLSVWGWSSPLSSSPCSGLQARMYVQTKAGVSPQAVPSFELSAALVLSARCRLNCCARWQVRQNIPWFAIVCPVGVRHWFERCLWRKVQTLITCSTPHAHWRFGFSAGLPWGSVCWQSKSHEVPFLRECVHAHAARRI